MANQVSVIIGGEAGAGINRSGFLFAKACLRGGLYVFGTIDYQSLIRGGHSFYLASASAEEICAQSARINLLLALNKETVLLHKDKLVSGGGIVYDGDVVTLNGENLGRADLKLYSLPLKNIVKELEGALVMQNTVALGAAIALLDYDLAILIGLLMEAFTPKVAKLNVKAANMGYDFIRDRYTEPFAYRLTKTSLPENPRMLLNGNEAVSLGAISAGCKFYAAYPMTPATGVLHYLAPHERDYGMIVVHAESEIAAINMVAGASFAGARAMTSTSGGGFSLMTEGLGMTGMTETPIVIMLAQRPGPSTGLPTYSGQGDLRFAIHASQGEFPRVVIAPGDVADCFYQTIAAFNLAEQFQIPVILITDKYLAESHGTTQLLNGGQVEIDRGFLLSEARDTEKGDYKRHKFTEDGISLRALPGTKGIIVRTNADEHDENGYTTEDPELATKMTDKRFKKLEALKKHLDAYATTKLYGPLDAETTILGWGSTKGPIREAMKLLNSQKLQVNYLQILYLNPFPTTNIQKSLKAAKKVVVIENNKTSQLSSLIREHLLMTIDSTILRYDGRPFNPEELSQKIKEIL